MLNGHAAQAKGETMLPGIKTVGIVGAGQMGQGIAHVCAAAGFNVKIVDISEDALKKARDNIGKNMDRMVSRGRLAADIRDASMGRIDLNTQMDTLSDCQLVVEAATENEDVKKQ